MIDELSARDRRGHVARARDDVASIAPACDGRTSVGGAPEHGGFAERVKLYGMLAGFVVHRVGREHCSHVREHLFAFTVHKYCSESNTV